MINDIGIIISQKKYGENSLIIKLFSQHHGIYRGFVKSARLAKTRSIFQMGNLISFEFRSRSEDALGQFFSSDLVSSYCSKIIFDRFRLSCANSLFAIIENQFLERESHNELFTDLNSFLQQLNDKNHSSNSILMSYVKLELLILKSLGYGLDLSSCAVTNSDSDLAFVSPKSAKAVSFAAGKPYQAKLLKLPQFLLPIDDQPECQKHDLVAGFNLSGFFLEKLLSQDRLATNQYQPYPISCRKRLLESLQE